MRWGEVGRRHGSEVIKELFAIYNKCLQINVFATIKATKSSVNKVFFFFFFFF